MNYKKIIKTHSKDFTKLIAVLVAGFLVFTKLAQMQISKMEDEAFNRKINTIIDNRISYVLLNERLLEIEFERLINKEGGVNSKVNIIENKYITTEVMSIKINEKLDYFKSGEYLDYKVRTNNSINELQKIILKTEGRLAVIETMGKSNSRWIANYNYNLVRKNKN